MATLAKLLDCLKWPKVAASGRPVGPNPQLQLVADPELSFGWQGNLFQSSTVLVNVAANTVLASVSIPDDCFYILDATCVAAGVSSGEARLALEILDAKGVTVYQLVFGFLVSVATAVGITNTPPAEIYNLRMHLPQGAVVQWRNIDVGVVGLQIHAGIALRKLYEENL